jgi:hypothetical protein
LPLPLPTHAPGHQVDRYSATTRSVRKPLCFLAWVIDGVCSRSYDIAKQLDHLLDRIHLPV